MCQGLDSRWRTLFGPPLPAVSATGIGTPTLWHSCAGRHRSQRAARSGRTDSRNPPSRIVRRDEEGRALLANSDSRKRHDSGFESVCTSHSVELPMALSARSRMKRVSLPTKQVRVLADCRVPDVPMPRRAVPPSQKTTPVHQRCVLSILPLDAIPGALGCLEQSEHAGWVERSSVHCWFPGHGTVHIIMRVRVAFKARSRSGRGEAPGSGLRVIVLNARIEKGSATRDPPGWRAV